MKERAPRSWSLGFLLLAAIAFGIVAVGCSKKPTAPSSSEISGISHGVDAAALKSTIAVQDRHTRDLMSVQGVVAVGTGLDDRGKPAIHVYTESKMAPGKLPEFVEGVRVIEKVRGRSTR